MLALVALLALGWASSQTFELGAVLDQRGAPGAYAYITTNIPLAYSDPTNIGLWFAPSMEVTLSQDYLDYWVQAQFLVDAPWATLSVRGKVEHYDNENRAEVRVGVLFGQ